MPDILTAIVIDDDKETTEIFSEYLKIIEVNVIGRGYNGKMAVDLYKQQKPDIVFLDLLMPDYDGLFALEHIRRINQDAYVVVITAYLDKSKELAFEHIKPNQIIIKPFEIKEIMAIVTTVQKYKNEQTLAVTNVK